MVGALLKIAKPEPVSSVRIVANSEEVSISVGRKDAGCAEPLCVASTVGEPQVPPNSPPGAVPATISPDSVPVAVPTRKSRLFHSVSLVIAAPIDKASPVRTFSVSPDRLVCPDISMGLVMERILKVPVPETIRLPVISNFCEGLVVPIPTLFPDVTIKPNPGVVADTSNIPCGAVLPIPILPPTKPNMLEPVPLTSTFNTGEVVPTPKLPNVPILLTTL